MPEPTWPGRSGRIVFARIFSVLSPSPYELWMIQQ